MIILHHKPTHDTNSNDYPITLDLGRSHHARKIRNRVDDVGLWRRVRRCDEKGRPSHGRRSHAESAWLEDGCCPPIELQRAFCSTIPPWRSAYAPTSRTTLPRCIGWTSRASRREFPIQRRRCAIS